LYVVAWIASLLTYPLGVTILVRGIRGHFLSRFPFFYSYLTYFLLTGAAMVVILEAAPRYLVTLFWLRFLTLMVAEFALLIEIGDRLFMAYPVLRLLGRVITIAVAGIFLLFYILPSLLEARPWGIAVLDLVKRSALTKEVIIIVLFAVARYYRISLGRNVGGIALGLAVYLAIHTANFALAEHFGRAVYSQIFSMVGPLSNVVSLIVWAFALWRYEPVRQQRLSPAAAGEAPGASLTDQLGRYNAALERLLRK
jgi:hypothetical protein